MHTVCFWMLIWATRNPTCRTDTKTNIRQKPWPCTCVRWPVLKGLSISSRPEGMERSGRHALVRTRSTSLRAVSRDARRCHCTCSLRSTASTHASAALMPCNFNKSKRATMDKVLIALLGMLTLVSHTSAQMVNIPFVHWSGNAQQLEARIGKQVVPSIAGKRAAVIVLHHGGLGCADHPAVRQLAQCRGGHHR